MHLLPKMGSMPSLLYPSLRDRFLPERKQTDGPKLRTQMTSKFIKLRSKLKFSKQAVVNRTISLPNVSRLTGSKERTFCYYDKEDESEMDCDIKPLYRSSQLALPPKHLFQKHCSLNDVSLSSTLHGTQDELVIDDDQSLLSSCPTWSTNEESEDEQETVPHRPATAIFVSLPMSSAAAASVARSRRTRPVRVQSSPSLGNPSL